MFSTSPPNLQRWTEIRAKGFRRYLVVEGVLRLGLAGAFGAIGATIWLHPDGWSQLGIRTVLMYMAIGCIWGSSCAWLTWRIAEKQFRSSALRARSDGASEKQGPRSSN